MMGKVFSSDGDLIRTLESVTQENGEYVYVVLVSETEAKAKLDAADDIASGGGFELKFHRTFEDAQAAGNAHFQQFEIMAIPDPTSEVVGG